MRTQLELQVVKAFRMRAGGFICGAILAALVGSSPAMAQSQAAKSEAAKAAAEADDLVTSLFGKEDADKPTALSSVDVVAVKPKPTALSGIDVVAKPRATSLDGLVVTATRTCPAPKSPPDKEAPEPKLVSTYPAEGQTVQPGYLVLRLTFDAPMACRGSLPQQLLAVCHSDDAEIWHQSVDKRSLLILCNLSPDTRYGVSVNVRIPEHFRALSGREPPGVRLSFATSGATPVTTEEDLVARDPQLAALLSAAPAKRIRASLTADADDDSDVEVGSLRVDETKRCLQPREPPDKGIPPPKVVSTFPAEGQAVQPGLLELRFTFDLPMACVGGVTVREGKLGKFDPCTEQTKEGVPIAQHWRHAWNRYTLRLQCRLRPEKTYIVTLNKTDMNAAVLWPDFKSLAGGKAPPYELTFTTSNAAPIQTEEDADVEDPVMATLIEGHEADREQ